jgi:hypothetical protein
MQMRDMKRTKTEKKKENVALVGPEDSYPYGLRLTLDGEQLKKLGLDTLPKVGKTITLHAKAKVIGARETSRSDGTQDRSLEIQLQKMGIAEGAGSMEEAISSSIDDADGDE